MVIIKKPYHTARLLNSNQKNVLYGEGILSDSIRIIGRKMLKGGKYLLKQYVFPNVMKLARETLSSGKKIFEETVKPNVQELISDKTNKAMYKIVNVDFEPKEFVQDTKDRLETDIINPSIDMRKKNISETIMKIVNGNGIKFTKNPKV